MVLRFKSKSIRDFEKEHESIFTYLDANIDNIIALIRLGNDNISEDRAFEILDAELEKEESDTTTVLMDIIGSLQKSGFFPKGVNLSLIKLKIQNSITKVNSKLELEEELQNVTTSDTSETKDLINEKKTETEGYETL